MAHAITLTRQGYSPQSNSVGKSGWAPCRNALTICSRKTRAVESGATPSTCARAIARNWGADESILFSRDLGVERSGTRPRREQEYEPEKHRPIGSRLVRGRPKSLAQQHRHLRRRDRDRDVHEKQERCEP